MTAIIRKLLAFLINWFAPNVPVQVPARAPEPVKPRRYVPLTLQERTLQRPSLTNREAEYILSSAARHGLLDLGAIWVRDRKSVANWNEYLRKHRALPTSRQPRRGWCSPY